MKLITLAQLATAAAACASSLAQAAPITYTFTGTTLDLAQLTVTGSITIDTDTFTTVTQIPTNTTGTTPFSSGATIAFSDGTSFTLDAGLVGNTYEIVNRSLGSNTFNVGTAISTPTKSTTLQINTYDLLSASASAIFQTPATDVSLGQAAAFNTPGSFNTGTFSFADNAGYTYAHAFSISAVTATAVPEPATCALMLAGLAGLGVVTRRRQQGRRV